MRHGETLSCYLDISWLVNSSSLLVLLCSVWDRILLCDLEFPGVHCVAQADLELSPSASASGITHVGHWFLAWISLSLERTSAPRAFSLELQDSALSLSLCPVTCNTRPILPFSFYKHMCFFGSVIFLHQVEFRSFLSNLKKTKRQATGPGEGAGGVCHVLLDLIPPRTSGGVYILLVNAVLWASLSTLINACRCTQL